jgi:glucokinase
MLTLGIDVGGSKLLGCVADGDGAIMWLQRREAGRALRPDELVDLIVEVTWNARAAGHPPVAVGIGFPGLCDYARGRVRSSVMLDGWHDVPLADWVSHIVGLPAVVDNDVNAAALCEATVRRHTDETMLFVAVGTGIGGALAVGQNLWRGASGVAGEIGNIVIDRGGRVCWCGRHGCLNTSASGSAIEQAAGIAPGTLGSAWASGGGDVHQAVDDAARALAVGLGNAVNLLNPSLVVLGGGVAELGPRWLAAVHDHLRGQAFAEALAVCRIELAQSGYQAGAVGAALLARAAADRADVVETPAHGSVA